jgi:transcriptional regulator with XRE-family HTH domain
MSAMTDQATEFKRQLGARIKEARKERGMSRPALAEALSRKEGADEPSGQQRIANYELGYNEPSASVMRYLSEILEVSQDCLSGMVDQDFDARFERIRTIYYRTDERGRDGMFGYARTQPVINDDRDEASNS